MAAHATPSQATPLVNGLLNACKLFRLQANADMLQKGAILNFKIAITIRQRLADASPTDAELQRELILSSVRLHEATGEVRYAEEALEIALNLQKRGALPEKESWMIDDLRERAKS